MTRVRLVVAFGLSTTGCFGSSVEAPVTALTREPVAQVARPRTVGLTPFDYASVPVLLPDRAPAARLRHVELNEGALAAELRLGDRSYYAWPASLGGIQRPVSWPTCVPGASSGRSTARADVLWLDSRAPSNAMVSAASGTFDASKCVFEAHTEATVSAVALVAGAVYAARECVESCDLPLGARGRREKIHLFAPASTWITSNDPRSEELLKPKSGPFSHLDLEVRRGTSTVAALTVEPEAAAAFRGEPSPAAASTMVDQYTIEIVWGEADAVPSGTAYAATVERSEPPPDDAQVRGSLVVG